MDLAEILVHEGAPYLFINQHVIRCNAGLAGIQGLAPGEALRGQLEVGVGRDDAGALAAQLQHHGGQVLGGGFHHEVPEGRAAGEEDDVPALCKQLRIHVPVTLDDGDVALLEGLGDHFLDHA